MKRIPLFLLAAIAASAGCGSGPPEPGGAGAAAEVAQGGSAAAILPDSHFRLELVADFNIATGASFEAIPDVDFGGISGLFFDPDRMEVVAISDSRADNRYFTLAVELEGNSIRFTPVGVTQLEDGESAAADTMGGASAVRRAFDSESIARAPNGNLFVSTEGIVARQPRIAPTIAEFQPDGRFVRFLPVPDKFAPESEGPQTRGIFDNRAFESLSVSPDGSRVFTATEAALVQDGRPPTADAGSLSRILVIGIGTETDGLIEEFIYPVEPLTLPGDFEPVAGENGLVEILALSNTELLALERNFVRGGVREMRRRNVIRIFRVSLKDATDVSDIFSLDGEEIGPGMGIVPVTKELILDFEDITARLNAEYPELDNFEGLSWGPTLPDGSPSLIVVSDNNFNPWQRTSFLLFRIRTD